MESCTFLNNSYNKYVITSETGTAVINSLLLNYFYIDSCKKEWFMLVTESTEHDYSFTRSLRTRTLYTAKSTEMLNTV